GRLRYDPLRQSPPLSAGSRCASSRAKNARCGVSSSSLSRWSLRVFPSLTECLATALYSTHSLLRWLIVEEGSRLLGLRLRDPPKTFAGKATAEDPAGSDFCFRGS